MSGLILTHGNRRPVIAADAFIAPNAVIVGDVEIGPGSSIWFGCVLRGDSNSIRIGARTNIQDGTIIHVNHQEDGGRGADACCTVVGDDVTVGHMALIHACRLENGAFVGMKACVMDGAVVEENAMVAAGALLTPNKRVRSGELWAGSPARLMRQLTRAELDEFRYIAQHYCELAASYMR
ncbi:MAG: gamma carbonic anhydrase family protein [Alphaproteobacteria bacterium]|nr:MAG: gamma carbonic anhydrase family protein [Alphaproteobacteria bacterium]